MESQGSTVSHEAGLMPSEIRRMLMGYVDTQALLSGVELGVFDALAESGGLALEALARRLGLPTSSLHRLLIYLCSRGLLEKRADGYANSAGADAYLVSSRPAYLASDAGMTHDLYMLFAHLSDALRGDSNRMAQAFPDRNPDPFAALYHDPTALRAFLAGMAKATMPVAAELCEVFDFGSAHCVLDVGGASATLLSTVLGVYWHLRGITFDLPVVAPIARESIADAGHTDRLVVVSGDMFGDTLPIGADVIILSWILHDWDDRQALALLQRCHAALEKGGAILVLEALLNDDGTGPAAAAQLSLTMLVATLGGRERTASEYAVLLSEAGFVRPEVRRMQNPWERHCVVGWKD